MKKLLFTTLMIAGTTCGFAKTKIDIKSTKQTQDPVPCTVSVTKHCEGVNKKVTSTRTDTGGDCNAAYTVANQNWSKECRNETIKKIIQDIQQSESNPNNIN